ncbi:MAG TPA: hypothetical protein VK821_06050 [Dehalococcoidia bacterium]|nr:hypothetical protein [Dehalococcoidia bacterium]
MKRTLLIMAIVAAALTLVGSAVGGNSIVNGHTATPPASSNLGQTGSGSGTPSGTLPFTGLDLAGIVVLGTLLVAGGLILRRTSRRTN